MIVDESSWHYGVFKGWEARKRKTAFAYTRPTLDLCRYSRIVFIHAPWRWFWQGWYSTRLGRTFWPWLAFLVFCAAGALAFGLYMEPWEVGKAMLLGSAVSIGTMLAILFFIWLFTERDAGEAIVGGYHRVGNSLVMQTVKAKKKRICPLIEIREEQHGQRG